ncbi:MAG: hypothetical protein IH582_10080 [Afipia sp.]|nr:hypothetical protein [Afipia sp.]
MTRVLHFTIGPVQGFIADAKRTRDLWAGSFLLSLLAGHAMAEVKANSGEILFPAIEGDPLFEAIVADRSDSGVWVGSLPNRFKADVTNCPDDIGERCKARIFSAWTAICERAWREFIARHVHLGNTDTGNTPREIWDRQTRTFWDVAWVEGESADAANDSRWLDFRKNWRSHYSGPAGAEDGDHCRLMGEFQEISGYHRTNARDRQLAFWKAIARDQGLDISETEPMSAIALVKRLFPRLGPIEGAMPWQPGGASLNIRHWPSVSYIAAVPWLRAVANSADDKAGVEYFEAAKEALGARIRGETETRLFDLAGDPRFLGLDGHLLHRDGILGAVAERIPPDQKEARTAATSKLASGLDALVRNTKDQTGVQGASEFCAILKMDGDGIGALLSNNAETVKAGLSAFSGHVIETFRPGKANLFDGVLIYAGGDDVLALLPVDTAIAAALHLRSAYERAFREALSKPPSPADASKFTLSGAIVFSQFKIPIRAALEQASHYLDEIAKEENGRNSLAIAVLKPGGISTDWVSTFNKTISSSNASLLLTLAGSRIKGEDEEGFSGGFFHRLKQLYLPLFETDVGEDQSAEGEVYSETSIDQPFVDPKFMHAVLAAEYRKQFGARNREKAAEEVALAIEPILDVSTPKRNTSKGPVLTARGFDFEAGLVIRFLATEGRALLKRGSGQ